MKHKLLLTLLLAACPLLASASYVIYPVPQQQVAVSGSVQLSAGKIQVICGENIDTYTKNRIQTILVEHSLATADDESLFVSTPTDGYAHIYIGVNGSGDAADTEATRLGLSRDVFSLAKYDRHAISIGVGADDAAEIIVLGEHCDAAFFGLASIEQILDAYKAQSYVIPCGIIYDYADLKNRGVVEGYYGIPYSYEVTKDLLRFMMRFKMNSYMYGAKDDPYHKGSYWKAAYPTSITEAERKTGYLTQDMMRDINDVSHETKVSFIWSIHPGNDYLSSSTAVTDIVNKFKLMYKLGVRQFGIFVDDVSIPTTSDGFALNASRLTEVQNKIDALWNTEGAAPADTVKPIQFVPQIYCRTFASSDEQEKNFFEALAATPSKVAIYTTGYAVWSVPNSTDVNRVRNYLGRDVAWWWNYPCNDPAADSYKLFTMDMYSNFKDESNINNSARPDLDIENCLGILSNPMQQGEAAKIALFSIADYTWNNAAFNNSKSWEASFYGICKGDSVKGKALRTIAPYLRTYDSNNSEITTAINSYKTLLKVDRTSTATLPSKLETILEAVSVIEAFENSSDESEVLFYNDIKPWLLKLRDMLKSSLLYTEVSTASTDADKWEKYIEAANISDGITSSNTDYQVYTKHGDLFVTPSNEVLSPFITYMAQNALGDLLDRGRATKPVLFSNLENAKGNVYLSSGVYRMNGTNTLQPGEYVGVELPYSTLLDELTVADTLSNNFVVLLSPDGKTWNEYSEETAKDHVKYICVKNEGTEAHAIKFSNAKVLSFTLPTATSLNTSATTVPTGEFYDGHNATYMTDGDYDTYTVLNANQVQGDAYTVKLTTAKPIHDVRVCVGTKNNDYMTVGNVQVSSDGETWTSLKVKGSNTVNFTMSLPQVVTYSDEMKYCDFEGTGESALYVRLYVKTANTSKWLRLYEIEVNRQYDLEAYQPEVEMDNSYIQELTDEDPSTTTATCATVKSTSTDNLVYTFFNVRALVKARIFRGLDNGVPVEAYVTTDGETWNQVATLAGGLTDIDMTAYPYARQLKLTWDKGSEPNVREILEVVSDSARTEVTKIAQVINATSSDVTFTPAGNGLKVSSAAGIKSVRVYSVDGRQLLSISASSQTEVFVPSLPAAQIAVVSVTTTDGKTTTAKVFSN